MTNDEQKYYDELRELHQEVKHFLYKMRYRAPELYYNSLVVWSMEMHSMMEKLEKLENDCKGQKGEVNNDQ